GPRPPPLGGQGRVSTGAGGGARTAIASRVRGTSVLSISAGLSAGPNPDAVPRLLRSWAGPAHAGTGRSRALPVDLSAGCEGTRARGRRADPDPQRARG